MDNNIVKHNIKRLPCLLAATLLQTSRSMLVSAKTVKIRCTPKSVEAGSTMLLAGFNFPELIYRFGDNLSYEWLNLSLAKSGTINEDDASYTTKMYKKMLADARIYLEYIMLYIIYSKKSPKLEIMFMESKYHSLYPDNTNTLTYTSKSLRGRGKKTLPVGDVWKLSQNYTLTV